jgi:outer membrane protein TolC
MNFSAWRRVTAKLLLVITLAGCTNHYRKSADKEAYRAIKGKTPLVRNMDPHFTIEQTNAISLEGLPLATNVHGFLGADGERERGASILRLEDALRLGITYSRAYQSRKEQLYLSALSLTLARHQFAPLFSAGGDGSYGVSTEQFDKIEIDPITGEPVVSDVIVEQHRVDASGSVGASWLIRDVGRITTAATADFLKLITGDPRVLTSSQLSATFLRPMLRDAGFKQEAEALIQAERDLLYDLRDFTQFRKDFSVEIATAFYRVLANRDAVRNSFANLQSSHNNAERSRALAQEGRITQADLGRLEQQELSAESAWINDVRTYKQALDNLKIQLGLSIDAQIVLDDRELEALTILHPDLKVDDSMQIALTGRFDYINATDQLEDAERRVKVAANLLLPRVDLVASAAMNSEQSYQTNGFSFALPDPERYRWNAGLNVDLGLDRKSERNAYRSSLINRNRAARAMVQQQDEIKLQVRDSWRTLDQAKSSYEISDIGVKLAERRVEEQNLLAEIGRARAQDQVDAQNALSDSKNQRTQALVTHTIARLQFWNNMGILYIKDNGQWEDIQHAKAQ